MQASPLSLMCQTNVTPGTTSSSHFPQVTQDNQETHSSSPNNTTLTQTLKTDIPVGSATTQAQNFAQPSVMGSATTQSQSHSNVNTAPTTWPAETRTEVKGSFDFWHLLEVAFTQARELNFESPDFTLTPEQVLDAYPTGRALPGRALLNQIEFFMSGFRCR